MTRMWTVGPLVLAWYGLRGSLQQQRWGVVKWRYVTHSTWRHGSAYLGPLKVMW